MILIDDTGLSTYEKNATNKQGDMIVCSWLVTIVLLLCSGD